MKDSLEIKWPWTMVWLEYVDEIISQIRAALPPDHELQGHDLFPGIKWDGRSLFIVDDDTTGQCMLMNFEEMRRWKETKSRVPAMTVFSDSAEVAEMIERDHVAECTKWNRKQKKFLKVLFSITIQMASSLEERIGNFYDGFVWEFSRIHTNTGNLIS